MNVFDLMYYGKMVVIFDDIVELVKDVYGDGIDKY